MSRNNAADEPVDVSVIVIGHDVREEIAEALASVEEHRGPLDVECIVVDNASTDGTAEMVAERFPAARVIRLARNERGPARNHGLRAARGRFRMFLDSDARLCPGALPRLVAFLEAHPDVGLVGPRLVYGDGEPQPSARRYPPLRLPLLRRPPLSRFFEDGPTVRRHLMLDVPMDDEPMEVEYVISACVLFSEAAQAVAGEMDTRIPFAEDVDWCFQIRHGGFQIAFDPGATVVHDYRRSTSRRPFSRTAARHLHDFLRLQWKWRRERRRLITEGAEMERRGWTLP